MSHLYGISQTTLSPITILWVNLMFLKFCTYLHSLYKGVLPLGTFISQLLTGHISDREIVNLPFDRGDSVMAGKVFTVEDLLPLGVSLYIPPFWEVLRGK